MQRFPATLLRALIASVSLLGVATAVHADTVITSLPYTITASGTYVLNGNLNSSLTEGNLISVNASNVTIDFRGHYISGPAGNTSLITSGVRARERSNVTIQNGTVANCRIGIYLEGNYEATTNSVNHRVDHMRVTYCTLTGIQIIASPASRITNCQISQIGFKWANTAVGIYVGGASATVRGNIVSTVTAAQASGIAGTSDVLVRQNTVSNAKTGISGGKYQDNLTAGCTTPFSDGVDAGWQSIALTSNDPFESSTRPPSCIVPCPPNLPA